MAIGAREAQMRAMREDRERKVSAPVRAVPRVEGVARGVEIAPPAYKAPATVTRSGYDVTVISDAVTTDSYVQPITGGADLDFKTVLDALGVGQDEFAAKMGVSVAAIRQARIKPESSAHRPPPKGWQGAVVQIAEAQIERLRRLIVDVRG